ncbi:Helix-turn-helix domain-containing protein [Streptomyces sp. 2224.1]|uniref:ArsR/SmtB family transcription factor n=1 Tax=unclassified Streptomyces TaxID=2593676 RepID=UPI000880DEA2|nr:MULTISPECIES: helix-turn-helix domain-containing protein [unclassified Streptomyces]PBC87012.1 helix-turn-helix protein [Streptomyces sp. 2321.6]SDQ64588.1 Helix-turn-helix domain-containing protein [Streptomyces sp. KS_16]SED31521.1 Helix-turn-helix domain-containing protein [Streptomyces sp. 2112.3]SED75163.1 Helix-turn-helix domain-containing protein [Streptomyces sp. 2224.1]SEE16517.1 Helix-turn-helix domain-containing protein [Streptomyces sp. 2133.1]
MTEEDVDRPTGRPSTAGEGLREHEVRTALLDLLAEVGVVTATEAAARLGYSSGLCSFHLRQLARHGHIEEAPHRGGRARPWRLRRPAAAPDPSTEEFGALARGLEDESWQHWLDQREQAPAEWRRDEAFSAVAYLTSEEMNRMAAVIRRALAPYQDRDHRPLARPEGARPVALITRLFPLLPHQADDSDDADEG